MRKERAMREKLKKMSMNRQYFFEAEIGEKRKTNVMLKDLRAVNDPKKIITDHVWIAASRVPSHFEIGDTVRFSATPCRYFKNDSCGGTQEDRGLKDIRKMKRVRKGEISMSLEEDVNVTNEVVDATKPENHKHDLVSKERVMNINKGGEMLGSTYMKGQTKTITNIKKNNKVKNNKPHIVENKQMSKQENIVPVVMNELKQGCTPHKFKQVIDMNKYKPLVTVVVVAGKATNKELFDCLNSIHMQKALPYMSPETCKIEVVVVNDEVVFSEERKQIVRKFPYNFRYIEKAKGNTASAKNLGIRNSDCINETKYGFIVTIKGNQVLQTDAIYRLFKDMYHANLVIDEEYGTKAYRKAYLQKHDIWFDETKNQGEDTAMLITLLQTIKHCKVKYVA